MAKQLHEFYVTRKCTKYEYFTVMAESMDEAKYEDVAYIYFSKLEQTPKKQLAWKN